MTNGEGDGEAIPPTTMTRAALAQVEYSIDSSEGRSSVVLVEWNADAKAEVAGFRRQSQARPELAT